MESYRLCKLLKQTNKQKNCRLFPPSKPLLYYPKRYIRYSTYLIIVPQGAAGSTEENAYRRRDWVTDAGNHRAEFSNFKLQIVVVAGENQNFIRIGI
jgi:hypothetical protein